MWLAGPFAACLPVGNSGSAPRGAALGLMGAASGIASAYACFVAPGKPRRLVAIGAGCATS